MLSPLRSKTESSAMTRVETNLTRGQLTCIHAGAIIELEDVRAGTGDSITLADRGTQPDRHFFGNFVETLESISCLEKLITATALQVSLFARPMSSLVLTALSPIPPFMR